MKAWQIRVEYKNRRNLIQRTFVISKKYDFDAFHRAIQIAFALENIELYEFEIEHLIIKRLKDSSNSRQSSMTLARLKKGLEFVYRYDVFEQLALTCIVEDVVDTKLNYPFISEFKGRNLYENYTQSKRKGSDFDLTWCNECLKGFSTNYLDVQKYYGYIEEEFKKLVSVKNWQDYVHGNIIEIECPHERKVYVGADATHDVHLDFYLNRSKLIHYLRKNNNAIDTSVCKYHDTITMSIFKLQPKEERSIFDLVSYPYGATLDRNSVYQMNHRIPSDEIVIFAFAYARYVECVVQLAEKNKRADSKKIVNYDLKGKVSVSDMVIENDQLHIELKDEHLLLFQPDFKNGDTLQIDVVSVYDDEAEEEKKLFPTFLILADSEELEEITLQNGSSKTIASEIIQSLLPLIDEKGTYQCVQVRDENMYDLLYPLCVQLEMEIVIMDYLDYIDSYIFQNYLKDIDEDDLNLTQEMLLSHLNDMTSDQEILDFYGKLSKEQYEEFSNEMEALIELLEEGDEEEAPIDYKKLN